MGKIPLPQLLPSTLWNYHSPQHSGAQANKSCLNPGVGGSEGIPREGLDVTTSFGCGQTNMGALGPNS